MSTWFLIKRGDNLFFVALTDEGQVQKAKRNGSLSFEGAAWSVLAVYDAGTETARALNETERPVGVFR